MNNRDRARLCAAAGVGVVIALAGAAHAAAPAKANGQAIRPDATMLQFPDVSRTHIVFVYGNDLWLVPREGGVAEPLASPPGQESFPKFSADGATIAFVGNYDGNRDVYTIPVAAGSGAGLASRVTHHPAGETVCDWTPDGRIIFFTNGFAGLDRQQSVFTVSPEGGLPQQLPIPYGTWASVSPDGAWLAYQPHTTDFRTWKRYRGGMATDIWLFNLRDRTSRQITDWEGTDTMPMWKGSTVYYLSDAGANHRLNIWSFDTGSGRREQITDFADYDVKWPSIGPGSDNQGEIVFQNGPQVHLLDLRTKRTRAVDIVIPGDRPSLRDRQIDFSKHISGASLSPSGKRLAVEARGEIWSLPGEQGVTRNLTRTSGVAERSPTYSPDGKWIAYLSDATGEYELYVMPADGTDAPVQLTQGGTCFRYVRNWSPDSKHIVYSEKTGEVFLCSPEWKDGKPAPGSVKPIAREMWANQREMAWSHDSGWIALILGEENQHGALYLYEVATGTLTRVTDPMFSASVPAFDRKGDYLYFCSQRTFAPSYSELDTTFVYRDTDNILAVPLRKDVKNPMAPRSDEEDAKQDGDKSKDKKDGAKAASGLAGLWKGTVQGSAEGEEPLDIELIVRVADDGAITGTVKVAGSEFPISDTKFNAETKELSFVVVSDHRYEATVKLEDKKIAGNWTASDGRSGTLAADRTGDAPKEALKIELAGFEERAIPLPIKSGNFGPLAVNDSGKLLFLRAVDRRPGDESPPGGDLRIFDFLDEKSDKKEDKAVISGVVTFEVSADGKKALLRRGQGGRDLHVVDAAADQKAEKKVPTDAMTAAIKPREEWKQIFTDTWRIQRDFFYVPNLHGVDWNKTRDRYLPMLQDCVTRDDLNYVLRELISELNVGHAYITGQGDVEQQPSVPVGLLGCDFELATVDGNTAYRIKRIYEGGPWDSDARGPLSQPGVDVKVGDFLLAVNGVPVDTKKDPWAAFLATADKTTEITVSEKPVRDDKARNILVKPLRTDQGMRYRWWIERNRKYVEYRTDGKVGYIYVPNTGINGQNDLFRQFYGQRHKQALIIDERWNGGGQIPTRFIELLNRPVTNYWARRDGKDWTWPPDSHQGPKCMLINGLAGSGGDMFPALFKQNEIGPLIGMRTWGGLVGISGNPSLIDGGGTTAPTFGYYEKDGSWGIEGHGVDPDILIVDDPAKMPQGLDDVDGVPAMGGDPQLDAAIDHIRTELERNPYRPPQRPTPPDRKGMGIKAEDK